MSDEMQRVVLAERPTGAPTHSNFRLEKAPMPQPGDGGVLVEIQYLSLDPYMRGRMDDVKSYAAPVPIGGTMEGGAVGKVLASNDPRLQPGDMVMGMLGWVTHGVLPGNQLRKLPPDLPVSTALGVLGMPGFTGWYGLTTHGRPKSGETLVVGAATGPVGSMVGQVAKAAGLRVVGVAGGRAKCEMAVETFGFDTCVDHRAAEDPRALRHELAAAAPNGVDIYFENVGGKTLEAVIPLMNTFGRIPVCGMISYYDLGGLGAGELDGPNMLPRVWRTILVNKLSVNGFIISDHFEQFPSFLKDVAPKVADGTIRYIEDIADGLPNAPDAFMGLLKGKNVGKQIVRVKADPQ